MRPGLTKLGLFKTLRNDIKIKCTGTYQWLKLHVSTFHTFYTYSLPSKPSTVQVVNSKVSCIMYLKFNSLFMYLALCLL